MKRKYFAGVLCFLVLVAGISAAFVKSRAPAFAPTESDPPSTPIPTTAETNSVDGTEPPKGGSEIEWAEVKESSVDVSTYDCFNKTRPAWLEAGKKVWLYGLGPKGELWLKAATLGSTSKSEEEGWIPCQASVALEGFQSARRYVLAMPHGHGVSLVDDVLEADRELKAWPATLAHVVKPFWSRDVAFYHQQFPVRWSDGYYKDARYQVTGRRARAWKLQAPASKWLVASSVGVTLISADTEAKELAWHQKLDLSWVDKDGSAPETQSTCETGTAEAVFDLDLDGAPEVLVFNMNDDHAPAQPSLCSWDGTLFVTR